MPEPAEQPPQDQQETGAAPGTWVDPYPAYNFKLSIGADQARFTQCSGIGVRVESVPYREGGGDGTVHQIPGRVEYAAVELRYGLTQSTELWEWFLTGVNGSVQRRNVSIAVLERDGVTEAVRWNLLNAWPSEWRGAPLDALGHEVAIESLTLVFEGLERSA